MIKRHSGDGCKTHFLSAAEVHVVWTHWTDELLKRSPTQSLFVRHTGEGGISKGARSLLPSEVARACLVSHWRLCENYQKGWVEIQQFYFVK